MKDLQQLQQNLENDSLISELALCNASLVLAFSRTGTEFDKELSQNILMDVMNAFASHKLEAHEFAEALKRGGLGMYGKTYKMTVQEVCIWVSNYLKETRPKFAWQ